MDDKSLRWKVISPYQSHTIPPTAEYPTEPPKTVEVPAEAESPRWKRAVVPMLRFAAVLSGAVPTAAAAEMPPSASISRTIDPVQPRQLTISSSEIDAGDQTEVQLQGAVECFFQPAEADEISEKLASAFHQDTTPEEQKQASGIIHSSFTELRNESKDIAKDLLKDPVEEAIKSYIVLRILDVAERRLKKRGEESHNKTIIWLASALETIRNLFEKKPEPKAVSTDEVSTALHSTPAQAEAALSAAFFVRVQDEWVPLQVVFYQLPQAGYYFANARGLDAFRSSDWYYPTQLRMPLVEDSKLIIERQEEQIRQQQEEIQALRAKVAELQGGG